MTETKELKQKLLQKTWCKVQKPEKVKSRPVVESKEKLLKIPRGNAENTYQYMWMAKTAKSLSHTKVHAKIYLDLFLTVTTVLEN